MALSEELQKLLQDDPRIWRGRGQVGGCWETLPTGHPALDEILPGGGWPLGALTEIGVPAWGIGELRLLLPALATLAEAGRRLVFVAPPYLPYGPGLLQAGIDLRFTLLIDLESAHPDVLWSMEKLLASPETGAVMAWPQTAAAGPLRRLQLAAEEGRSLGFLFRSTLAESSPAALRLEFTSAPSGLEIHILKARGSLARKTFFVSL